MSIRIESVHRIVVAIREHIATDEALTGGDEAIRVDKPADLRIVIPALQIIESRLFVVVVAAVTNGVDSRQRTRN